MNIDVQIISIEDAALLMSSEDGVWVGSALTIDNPLIELLSAMGERLKGLTLVGSTNSMQDDIFNPKYSKNMRIVSLHNLYQGSTDKTGYAKASGEEFSQSVCRLFGINTVALRMSPPDADGFCRVDPETMELTREICANEGITRRIAMLDLSQPSSKTDDGQLKISIKNFDYICSYRFPETQSSIIA